jgi:hypothetical protein
MAGITFRGAISHTETRPYLRNASMSRGFERTSPFVRWRPDWLAGVGGFELPHLDFFQSNDKNIGEAELAATSEATKGRR